MSSDSVDTPEKKSLTICQVDTFDMSALAAVLEDKFGVEVLPREQFMEADFLFCDTFTYVYEQFHGVRILITAENHPADLNEFDYCMTHDTKQSDRKLYFPWYQYRIFEDGGESFNALINRPAITLDDIRNRKFCAFVCRNGACKARNRFVQRLMKRRHVDCGGPFMNNIGHCVKDKVAFQQDYLFSVAYENEVAPGYITEKIVDAFLSRSIPIYRGDPQVVQHFNPEAFILASDFRNDEEMIDYILKLADDPERMLRMLNAPVFRTPNIVSEVQERVLAFFAAIFERGSGAVRRTRWQRIKAVLQKFYGHGFFRTFRRISRRLRGKKMGLHSAEPGKALPSKWEKR